MKELILWTRTGVLASLLLLACASANATVTINEDMTFDKNGLTANLTAGGTFATPSPGGHYSWSFGGKSQPTSGDIKVYRAGVLVQVYHYDGSGVGYLDVYTDSSHGGSGFPSSFSGNAVTLNVANVSGTNQIVYYPTSGQPGYGDSTFYSSYWGQDQHDILRSYTFVADPPSTTTTLTSSQNPSLFGGAVIFTAIVTGTAGPPGTTPTGTVTFKDGTNSLGTGTLNGSGVAYFGTGALTTGTHSITAVYGGDSNYSPSTSSVLSQTVNWPTTSIPITNPSFETNVLANGANNTSISGWTIAGAICGAFNPTTTQYGGSDDGVAPGYGDLTNVPALNVAQGRNVAFASVGGSISQTLSTTLAANTTYALSGAVGRRIDGPAIGSSVVRLRANGVDLQTTTTADPGSGAFGSWTLTYTAPSSGGQVGQAIQIVLDATLAPAQTHFDNIKLFSFPASITLASSQNPSLTGGAVTFTATVTETGGTPTGTVVFMEGTSTLGSGTLSTAGQPANTAVANFSTAALTAGSHRVTAVYGGDSTFPGGTSSTLSQTVSGPNSITINNPGFEDVQSAGARNSPSPIGTGWTVYNAANPNQVGEWNPAASSGYAPMSGYVGNNVGLIYNSSQSGPTYLYQNVGSIPQSGTYRLTLLVANDAWIANTGNPIVALATGAAGSTPASGLTVLTASSSSTPNLTSANKGIMQTWTFSYTIPATTNVWIELENNQGSSAVSIDFDNLSLVGGTPTTTALTSSPNPSSSGGSVTFTATVTGTGSSFPTTGTVTFYDSGTITLGTGTLNSSGVATLTTSALTDAGTHSITAAFGGGGSYGGSISSTLTQTVSSVGPANAYKITANTTTPAAGANDTLTITQVDSSGNTETGFTGSTNLTFSGLSVGPDSSPATVNGTSLGTAISVSFVSGVATATLVAHKAETASLHVTDGFATSSSTGGSGDLSLTVSAGTATQVRVETAANGSGTVVAAQGVTSGSSITAFAVTRDTYGNFVANTTATWSLVSKTGGVADSDLVASGDTKGATFTGHRVGTAVIDAASSSLTKTDSGTITVNTGSAALVRVETSADGSGTVVPAQNVTAGNSITVYAITRDANSNFVANAAATWSLVNKTGGVVNGDLVAAGDTKSATFTGHLVGTAAIDAASGSLTKTDSGTLTVTPGTAAKLVYTSVPSTGTAGTAFSVTVQSQDVNGNAANVTSDTTVTLSKASGAGTLSGTLTGIIANGSSSVTISTPVYSKADTMTLTASETAGMSLSAVTSGDIVFSAGTATKLVYTSVPSTGTAGTAFSVTVQSQDTNSNPSSPTSDTQITLSKASGGGTLSGTLAGTIPASGNSVTISTPVYSKADTMTLTATATAGMTSLAAVTSGGITFSPGAASAANSTISPPTASITADGTSTQPITVQARDANDNNLTAGGATVVFSKTGGGSLSGTTDNGDGTFTATLTSPATVGSATVSATLGGVSVGTGVGASSSVVTYVAGAATQTSVETAADGTGVVSGTANVSAGSSITVYVITRDANGNFVGNPSATWSLQSVSGGVVSGDLLASGDSKSATFTGHVLGSAIIQAIGGGFTGQSGVKTVVAGAVAQTRVETAADGSGAVVGAQNIAAGSSLTAYAITRDANTNFVANPSASWTLINETGGVVNGDLVAGGASAVFTGHVIGSGQIQAVAGGFTGDSGVLTVVPGAVNGTNSTISASPTSVSTDGGATTTLTVTAKDAYTNVIPAIAAANVVVAATGTGNTLVQPATATDTNGQTTATLASTKAESKTVSVTINGTAVTQTASVTFTAGALSADNSTVSASPGSVTANGVSASTITVTAKDAHSNPIPGIAAGSVVLAATGSGNTLVQPSTATDASGQTTGTLASTQAEGKTVSATISGTPITQTASVTFTAGTLDHFAIGAISSPQTAGTGFNIGITAQDANNNTVTGFGGTVDLSTTAGTISPTTSGSFVSGVLASQTVTVTGAGTGKTITATDHAGSGKSGTSGTFTVNPGALSPGNSTISPATASKLADGVSTQVITVQARDLYNNNLTSGGATVAFAKTGGGTLSGTTDHGDGTYTAILTSPSSTGSATVTATIGATGVGTSVGADSCVVTFTPLSAAAAYSTLSPATASRAADGSSTVLLTVQARDSSSNNLTSGGATVVIFKQGGAGTLSAVADNGNGTYTATLTAPTTTGTTVLGATLDGTAVGTSVGASNSVVTFVPGPVSASHSTVTADPTNNVTADGVSFSTITVAIKDAHDNPIPGQTVALSVAGHSYSISAPALTDTNGLTSANIKSTLAETKTISASVGATNITQQALITFVAAAPNAFASSVSVSPNNNVPADGTTVATITVTLMDANFNPVSGQSVTVSVSGSGNTVSTPAATDASGQTTATVSSTVVGTKTVSAHFGSTTIDQQPTVTFVGAPATQLVFTTQPSSAVYGSALSPAVVVKTRDAGGNDSTTGLPSSRIVTLSLSSGTGSLLGTASLDIGTAAGNGTVSFSNLKVSAAGTGKQLTASAGGLTNAVSASFTITPLPITITAAANTRVYDGTTNAAATPTVSPAVVSGDTANFTESYATKSVGTNKTLIPAGTVSDGNSGNNYTYTFASATNGVVTAKGLTVSGITASNKVYDATTVARLNTNSAALVGVVSGDNVTLDATGAAGAFADANVGTGKTVTVSGLSLGGADASNYSLTQPTTSADITAASTLSAVGSSANPALPGAAVTFTNTLSVVAPGAGTPTGMVTFRDGTNALGTASLNGSAVASFSTNSLAHGSHVITAEYAGDGNFLGSTNSLSPNQLINRPPSIGSSPVSFLRQGSSSLRVRISTVLTNASVSDLDGDTFALTAVGSPAVNGASVIITGSFLFYTPASVGGNVNDSFPYTVTDSLGGTNQGLVNVLVTNLASGIFQQVYAYTNGSILLKFDAIPNYSYVVQRASSPNGPWSDLGTNAAAGNGLFQYVDPEPPQPQGFYRVRLP